MKKIGTLAAGLLTGGVAGAVLMRFGGFSGNHAMSKKNKKFKSYYNVLNQWLYLKNSNRNLSEYFEKMGYKRIAIYGLGELGNRLIEELNDTDIEIVYGVDRNITFCSINTFVLEEVSNAPRNIDAMIVTAVFAYGEVMSVLKNEIACDIVSLEDVVFGV